MNRKPFAALPLLAASLLAFEPGLPFDTTEGALPGIDTLLGTEFALGFSGTAFAQGEPAAPTGGAPKDAPRSRLTLSGEYTVESIAQKNFYLGGGGAVESGTSTDFDAFWAQELTLRPRLILSDNLNITTQVDLAQAIWGLDSPADENAPVYGGSDLPLFQLDWAYLAFRHRGTGSRWYIGRQEFRLGHGLVLDTDAYGIQTFIDFPRMNGSLGLAVAKMSEGSGLSDENNTNREDKRVGPDGRDADLFFAQWNGGSPVFRFQPFFAYYQDRSNADGATLYPNRLGYHHARFQPNVTRANVIGLVVRAEAGDVVIDLEYDSVAGVDRVKNETTGADGLLDINNGDLSGSNVYLRVAFERDRFGFGGIFAQGTGDDDPTAGEGNLNRLATDGSFYITEVWEDSVLPPRGFYPGGLGSPLVRGYRELENTRVLQGFAEFRPTRSTRLSGSFSLLRSSEDLRPWADENGDGVLSSDEFGSDTSNELGSEFDLRFDWTIDRQVELTLRGGRFLPRVASSYLLDGSGDSQEPATEYRATITVPIPEFSLGG